jgi:glycosyltransferase involved in cell wall biosynthesis
VIYDVHDLWPEMFEAKFGKRGLVYWAVRLAERLTYACADVVLATNESVRVVAGRRGRKAPDRIFVVRTSPKIPDLNFPPDPTLKKGRKYLVGYIGVMGKADGVHYLLDTAARLVHGLGRRDVQFLLMGTGPEFDRLVQQRDECGLTDFVEMPGRVSNEFLFTALRTMDLGVSSDPKNPYNDHCTMNKVLEYMAFGKAQVMFDLKEGQVSAAEAAAYVADNSAAQMAQTILELLGDPARRERMGRVGAERIQRELKWEKSVDDLLRAYAAALDGTRPVLRAADRPGR